jgi:hypothetical protein
MFTSTVIPSSLWTKRFSVVLICVAALAEVSCGHTQAAAPIPMETVMQAVRDYGKGHQPTVTPAKTAAGQPAASADELLNDTDGLYQTHIASVLAQGDFAQLEKEARKVRADKSRLQGGVWKLFGVYDGAGKPVAGSSATESDWKEHLATLKKWIAAYPESATARIALAKAYVEYAWAARGNGYADTVSDSGWDRFGERISLAKAALLEAARLKEKCPYWYEAMQIVALAEGWDKAQARELLDQAAAFEPSYYHYYREYANFLLPKWYGEEGETQAFAEEVASRLKEPDASIVYYEIASLLACQCDKERDSLQGMSWPRVKQGYEKLTELYGSSNLKLNRFAYMSFVANDQASAKSVFPAIHDDWNHLVWHSAENFEAARAWAEGGAGN